MYARSLSRLALVLAGHYVLLVISVAFPPRLLDYDWIQRVTATLINGSSMPLLALLVLVVGGQMYPENQQLHARQQIFMRLAGVAVVGFLLLIPTHIYMSLLQQSGASVQLRALEASERQLNAYRQAASSASSVADLQARLAKLNAPAINPGILARPLPEVKAQAAASFNQVAAQITENRQALAAQSSWTSWAPEVTRVTIACLLLAFGFATFAQSTPSGPLLIDDLEQKLKRMRHQSLFRSDRPRKPIGQLGMIRSISYMLQSFRQNFNRRPSPQLRRYKRQSPSTKFQPANSFLAIGEQAMSSLNGLLPKLKSKSSKPKSRRRRSHEYSDQEYIELITIDKPNDTNQE